MIDNTMRHPATIEHIDDDGSVTVVFSSEQSCGSCAAKGVCGSDVQKRFVLIDDGVERNEGDSVMILISKSKGVLAIFLAYFMPVVIILGVLLILQYVGVSELRAGVISLISLALYFVVLRFFRNKIERNINIAIE